MRRIILILLLCTGCGSKLITTNPTAWIDLRGGDLVWCDSTGHHPVCTRAGIRNP